MPTCTRCGEENAESARFCSSGGARLGTAAASATGRADERRVITALFVDLAGFTSRAERLDPEDVARLLRPYHARVRAELERYGGTVEKFIGDAVVAIFGAPVAHEDDPERAVRAAFAVRDAIDDLNASDADLDLHVRIGINTGQALVALDARASEGEALAAGDVVNTAARLQQAAPTAGILVGEATYAATRAAVEYEVSEPIVAKGKHLPVPAWRAVVVRPLTADRAEAGAPLIGRRSELEQLRAVVRRAHDERAPKLITIVGEPGLGKSRLVAELCRTVAEDDARTLWLQGRALPYGEGVAFWAFAEMIKAHAGILESDSAADAALKLRAAVNATVAAAEADWVLRRLSPLVGVPGEDVAAGERREEPFAAWRSFVEALATERPTVLAFEDLQWADDALLAFVEHLAEWALGAPVALVCTARPELRDRRPNWPGDLLTLTSLTQDETKELITQLVGDDLPSELAAPVLARAGGNPLYAEQFASLVVDREAGAPAPALPQSVQALIAARLDALAPDCRALLQDAAVLGKGFWVGAVAQTGSFPAEKVDRLLRELRDKQLVRSQPRSAIAGETQYAFWHLVVRDVAYSQIPRSRRAEKHRLVAEWIESVAPDRAESHAEMLAHHYARAIEYAHLSRQDTSDLVERGRFALRRAGDRALALYSFAAAVRFYGEALEIWPEDDRGRTELLFSYAKARFWAEGAGEEDLERAREALLAAGDKERAAEAEVMLSRLHLTRGDRARASELAHGAVALLVDRPPSRAHAEALSNLAAFLVVSGETREAIEVGSKAMAIADELDIGEIRAHSRTFVGIAHATTGDRRGVDELEEAIRIGEELNSPEVVRAYANLATLLVNVGELHRAWDLYARGRAAATRFGDARALSWLGRERLYEQYWRGEWDEALAAADALLAGADGAHYMDHDCRHVRASIRLARGDVGGALEDTTYALEFARDTKDPGALYPSLAIHACALAASPSNQVADAVIAELLGLWERAGFPLASFWTAEVVFALYALGRHGEFAAVASRAKVQTRWLDAAARFANGDFVSAAQVYERIGALPEQAISHAAAAKTLSSWGRLDEAAAHAERALAFYRRVKADGAVRDEMSTRA